jgi:hypothetical protein
VTKFTEGFNWLLINFVSRLIWPEVSNKILTPIKRKKTSQQMAKTLSNVFIE